MATRAEKGKTQRDRPLEEREGFDGKKGADISNDRIAKIAQRKRGRGMVTP